MAYLFLSPQRCAESHIVEDIRDVVSDAAECLVCIVRRVGRHGAVAEVAVEVAVLVKVLVGQAVQLQCWMFHFTYRAPLIGGPQVA